MRLRWTMPAAEDLEAIHIYLKEHHPEFADSTVRTLYKGVRSLRSCRTEGASD